SGDISRPRLGLDAATAEEVQGRITHAIHLAALYNLSAPRDVSILLNVDGTRHVLDFLEGAPSLERFAHTSTIAVVGTHTGLFREDDLDVGQGFKNAYDETKFLAEQLVRERRDRIPTVILRPATVVGDSRSGAIEKIDGPYYALTMIARNLHRIVPDTGGNRFYIAPVDFVAHAYYRLFEDEESVGKVFHLIDADPPTYLEFLEMACDAMGRPRPWMKVPAAWMKPMGRLPMFERITGVPREAFEHSFFSVEYDVSQVAPALEKHGISCPPVRDYIDVMVRYFLEHSDDPAIRKGDWRAVTT
ncbi:MAG: 3-beta hydroxysteroid dehydrogenase, partial [Candidatus Dadabacteria bacterium]